MSMAIAKGAEGQISMEKKIVKVPHYKKVEDGFTEKEVFVARDGKEFLLQKACSDYEKQLEISEKYQTIKKFESYIDLNTDGTWFFAENEEELEMIKRNNWYYRDNTNKKDYWVTGGDDLKPQSWFLVRVEDGGDRHDDVYYVTLDEILSAWEEFLQSFPKT